MIKTDNQIKIGSIMSYIQMALSIIIGLAYTPVMLRLLGQSEYGLYSTVSSTISLLSVLNLGFSSAYVRYFARYKKENDNEAISKLNGLFMVVFIVIGLIALICGIYLSFNLDVVFDNGLTVSEYKTAKVLMLLLTFSLAESFPMSVYQTIISAHERFVFLKGLSVIRTVVSPLVTLPLLLMGYRSIAMVAVTVVVSLIVDLSYLVYAKNVLHTRFAFRNFDTNLLKSIFIFTSFIAINMVIDQINNNMDKVLLARFKGTECVAVYSIGYYLYNYYMSFSLSISGVFTPKIHRIYNLYKNDKVKLNRELTDLFIRVGRVQYLVLGLIGSGLCFFGKPFIFYWVGDGYTTSYYVALLLIIPATIPLIQNLGIEIQRAENNHKFRSIIYAAMATINLILTVFLCQLYGAVGAAIGTAASLIIANGLIMNIFYHKRCNLNIILFWKNIANQSKGLIIPILFGILVNRICIFDSLFKLFALIVLYTGVYCLSMWVFGMNEYEKELVSGPAIKLLKKIGVHH